MKRVLVITYYWPPSGGAGVQRWLKFTKYLPEYGWQPVVYTPENPEAPVDDPSLLEDIHPEAEVIKRPIWEPYRLYKRFIGMGSDERINAGFLSENEKPRRKEGLSVWIRGNLFIPDARKYWIRPSVRFLRTYLREHPVDAVISTGPPHSMHLIALKLKRQLELPWIADFRDPWTQIDFYDRLRLTGYADRRHRRLERAVLGKADRVIAIGKTMAEQFRHLTRSAPVVIPNGYDETDFSRSQDVKAVENEADRIFRIVHIGAMNRDRNHPEFWEALSELKKGIADPASNISVHLVGKADVSVMNAIRGSGLEEIVKITPYMPHNQVTSLLQRATILYLPINRTPNAKSIKTGKLFEYLAAGRPVLGIGPPDGDAAAIIEECGAGAMINFGDTESLKNKLHDWMKKHREGELLQQTRPPEQYTRRNLTGELSAQLDAIS